MENTPICGGKRGFYVPLKFIHSGNVSLSGYLCFTKERPLKEKNGDVKEGGGSESLSNGVTQIIRGGKGKKGGQVKCGLGQWFAIHAVSLQPKNQRAEAEGL